MSIKDDMIALMPNLRAFAVSLCGNIERADELLQETLLKALDNLETFTEGTNLRAWLFTILRNTHFSELRRKRRSVEIRAEGDFDDMAWTNAPQLDALNLQDVREAFNRLPAEQRSALLSTRLAGMSYEEAAESENTAIGTVKSRVHRAVYKLREILGNDYDEYGHIVLDHEVESRRRQNKHNARLRRMEEKVKPEPITHFPVRSYSKDEIDALNAVLAQQPVVKSEARQVVPVSTLEMVSPGRLMPIKKRTVKARTRVVLQKSDRTIVPRTVKIVPVEVPHVVAQPAIEITERKVVPIRERIVTASQPALVRSRLFVPKTTTYAGGNVIIRSTILTRI